MAEPPRERSKSADEEPTVRRINQLQGDDRKASDDEEEDELAEIF